MPDPSSPPDPLRPLPSPPPPSSFPPSPSHLYHRAASPLHTFHHSTLTLLLSSLQSHVGSALTYVGIGASPVGFDISRSIHRAEGIDPVYEWGKWWAGLARHTHHTTRHTLSPLIHATRPHQLPPSPPHLPLLHPLPSSPLTLLPPA